MALAKNYLNVWTSRPQLSRPINVRKWTNHLPLLYFYSRNVPPKIVPLNKRPKKNKLFAFMYFLKTFRIFLYLFLVPKPFFDVIFCRMLNHLLSKQKETSRRFLNITVARVVAVSPQMRLVQDNPNSVRYQNPHHCVPYRMLVNVFPNAVP